MFLKIVRQTNPKGIWISDCYDMDEIINVWKVSEVQGIVADVNPFAISFIMITSKPGEHLLQFLLFSQI